MALALQNARKITANIPAQLLKQAQQVTSAGITETLIAGLKLLKKTQAYDTAMKLKGKLRLQVDLEESRERHRR